MEVPITSGNLKASPSSAKLFNILTSVLTTEIRTRNTMPFSRTTLIYSFPKFLTSQPPLACRVQWSVGPGPHYPVDTETSSMDINFDKAQVMLPFCILHDTTIIDHDCFLPHLGPS